MSTIKSSVYLLRDVVLYIGELPSTDFHSVPLHCLHVSLSDQAIRCEIEKVEGNVETRSIMWTGGVKKKLDFDNKNVVMMFFPPYHPYSKALLAKMSTTWIRGVRHTCEDENDMIELFLRLAHENAEADLVKDELDKFILGYKIEQAPHLKLDRRVIHAIEKIETEWSENVFASEIAREVNISEGGLTRLFKQQTGLTFSQYRQLYKMRNMVIAQSHVRSHSSAAYDAGFYDISHLLRSFKKNFGFSLTEVADRIEYKLL